MKQYYSLLPKHHRSIRVLIRCFVGLPILVKWPIGVLTWLIQLSLLQIEKKEKSKLTNL